MSYNLISAISIVVMKIAKLVNAKGVLCISSIYLELGTLSPSGN